MAALLNAASTPGLLLVDALQARSVFHETVSVVLPVVTLTALLTAELHLFQRSLPARARLSCSSADPLALQLKISCAGDQAVWVFGRCLLADGVFQMSGEGDVRVWPATSPEDQGIVEVMLRGNEGSARVSLPLEAVQEFLTISAPLAAEHFARQRLDWEIDQLLRRPHA